MTLLKDDHIAGVDCGATKIMVQSGMLCSDRGKIIPGQINNEYYYYDHPDWDEHFNPVSLDIQLSEFSSDKISLTNKEVKQGNVIIDTILQSFTEIDNYKIGLCFPGLKSQNGIAVMANGPRIPDMKNRLNKIKTIFNDSDCCVIGEWKSTIGKMQNMDNCIYIGGGTGIADGVIINGQLLDLNKIKELPRSWEINISSNDTVESCLSPAGMIEKHNEIYNTRVKTLIELSNEKSFNDIFDKAVNAFSILINDRIRFFHNRGKIIQVVVIGHRLGQFLEDSNSKYREKFQNKIDIPIKLSTDRRTAALGAAMAIACF